MTSATDDSILRQDMPQALHKGTSINLVDRFLVPFHGTFTKVQGGGLYFFSAPRRNCDQNFT